MAHAAEAPGSRRQVRLQHRRHRVAETQVGMPHDPGACAGRTVDAAGAHRGDTGDELRLADGRHLGRALGAIHGAALHEHRGPHVVARAQVAEKLVEQVPGRQRQGVEERVGRGRGTR